MLDSVFVVATFAFFGLCWALARQLARDLPDPEAQIGTGDDLAVHYSHDPIHFQRSVGGRG